jgi:hypothetical protein
MSGRGRDVQERKCGRIAIADAEREPEVVGAVVRAVPRFVA